MLVNSADEIAAVPDDSNQPLRIVNELLARTIAKVPLEHLEDLDEVRTGFFRITVFS